MNTYLKYQSPAMQFVAFLGLAAGFFIISILISNFFFADLNAVLLNKNATMSSGMVGQFKWEQLISSTFSFIFPALLFGYFSSPKALAYIGVRQTALPLLILLSVLLLVFVQPFVGWLGNMNSKINFGSLQKPMEEAEAVYNRALQVFLEMKSPFDLVINLFIMALLPAIGEELFFRGALQTSLMRVTRTPWLAIFISSGIFALLHGTFFKILPIFTLGVLLGTVFYVTRNLWYTITIHFLNNALAVLATYFATRNETIRKFADDKIDVPVYSALISLVIVCLLVYYIKKKSDEVLPQIVTNEDNDYLA